MTTTSLKFRAHYVPMLAPFIATKDIRYYLKGIRVERAEYGGVFLVATNGHTLAAIHDAGGGIAGADGMTLRCPPAMVSACRSRRKTPEQHVLVRDNRLTVAPDFNEIGGDHETYVLPGRAEIVDTHHRGGWVDWRRVLPDFDKLTRGTTATMNPAYLSVYEKLSGRNRVGLTFWSQGDPTQVTVVQHDAVPEMMSLIMPVSHDSNGLDNLKPFFWRPVTT